MINPASIYDWETTTRRFDGLSNIVWPLSLFQFALKVKKNAKFVIFVSLTFLNAESMSDSTDKKTAARRFDTIHDILRSLSLEQSLLKGRNAPIWRSGKWAINEALQWKTKRKKTYA